MWHRVGFLGLAGQHPVPAGRGKTVRKLVFVLCVICQVVWLPRGVSQVPKPEDFRLPQAVSGEATRVIPSGVEGVGDQAFEIKFESGPDWSRFELWMDKGGFGLGLVQFAIEQDDESLNYVDMARQASITDNFKRLGWGAGEIETSPIAVLRGLQLAAEVGYDITTETLANGHERFSWINDDVNQSFTVEVDHESDEVVALEMGTVGVRGKVVYSYAEWEPLGNGYHYPRRITFDTVDYDGPSLVGRVRIDRVKALGTGAKPSPYALPDDVMIRNEITGQITNAAGDNIKTADEESQATNRVNTSSLTLRNALIAVAAIMIAIAGLVTALKRKGVM